ncbi:MAG TPA: succinate dehydrogenase, cytochrome b556 subunit [Candidatus Binatia bacterium]|nr:succinate dehydrogenase, cytochrome b556 subunit [Candidatus Binatia bacterium]
MITLFGYRVSWAQLAWFGHRASGLGVLFYLFMHIVETSMLLFGPEVYNAAVGIFKNLPARLGEVVLMAALVYHALNGLRVIVMDFWPSLTVYYRPLTYGVIGATVTAMLPLSYIMLRPFAPWGSP